MRLQKVVFAPTQAISWGLPADGRQGCLLGAGSYGPSGQWGSPGSSHQAGLGPADAICLQGPHPPLPRMWVFSANGFHLSVERFVCLVQFLPTFGVHHERPFFFLKQIQNNTHDEVQAGCLWKKATSPNYFSGTNG